MRNVEPGKRQKYRVANQALVPESCKMVNHAQVQRRMDEGEFVPGIEYLDDDGEPLSTPVSDVDGDLVFTGTTVPVWTYLYWIASGKAKDEFVRIFSVRMSLVERTLIYLNENPDVQSAVMESMP